MIEIFLCVILLFYSSATILLLTVPLVLGIIFDGIEGLKDGLHMLVEKSYYSNIVIPTFALITYAIILKFLIAMFIISYNVI